MDEAPVRPSLRNGAGDAALACGLGSLALSVMPFVGELVALPVALAALVLGLIGVRRVERGAATNPVKALLGALCGALALFVAFVTWAAGGAFS